MIPALDRLGPGRGDIFYACPEEFGQRQIAALRCTLSADEVERAARFHLDAARTSFIVTRALLRHSLSRYVDVAPTAWVFTTNVHGKPRVEAPSSARELHFNVSHTPGLCVCIIAGSEVGIDVQNTGRPPPWRVLDRYLTPSERQHVWSAPEPERAARFFECWTLKEAYVKARGLGFALPLSQIGFSIDATEVRLTLGARSGDDPRRWLLGTWRATREHQLSFAIQRGPIQADEAVPRTLHRGFGEAPAPAVFR